MRIPLLLDADKSVTSSAQTYLRNGRWKLTCDDTETTFRVIIGGIPIDTTEFEFHEGSLVRVEIKERGKAFKINIYAERL